VRAVAPLVLEKEDMVQLSALGALRNISSQNTDTAEEMVNQDIMTPLESFFALYTNKPSGDLKEADYEVLNEGLNLMWNLVEASPTASNLFKCSNILEYALSLLGVDGTGPELSITILNLLSSASDQNQDVADKILAHKSIIERYLVHPNQQLRMSSVLLFTTIFEEEIFESTICPKVFEIIAENIKQDLRKSVCDVSSSVPVTEEMEMEVDGQLQEQESDNKLLKECENSLCDQQTALEILANLCFGGEEDNEDWEEESVEDDSEEIDDMDEVLGEGSAANVVMVNPLLVEAVLSHQLIPSVLEKANSLPENVQEILKGSSRGKKLLNCHTTVRTTSFLCLSNMLDVLSVDDFGGAPALFSTWNGLGTLLVQEKDAQLLEAASSCMRSVTTKLCADKEGKTVMNITQKELEAIVEVGQSTQIPEIRMNMVNVIGDISILLSKTLSAGDGSGSSEVFKILINWLVDGGCKDSDLRVVTESLDKLFDAFSEDYTDHIFFNLNLLPKFKAIENSFKIKLKTQRGEMSSDSAGIINMAKVNLKRFIKYKEKRCK